MGVTCGNCKSFQQDQKAMNQHGGESGNTVDHEECGSHFDQAEEEEEVPIGVKNPSAVFKGNRYSHDSKSSGRRGITWYQNDVTPESKQKTTEEEIDATQGNDLVSWSLGVSPPQERRKPRQGNLTPAHKLIQDRKIKCSLQKEQQDHKQQQFSEVLETKTENSTHFLNQLANMCNSLLQNEHILLSILKSQSSISSMSKETLDTRKEILRPDNQSAMKNMRDFFQIGNRLDKIKQTLSILHTCSDRIEQHKLEMEYLQHQFSLLDIHSQENNNRKVDLTLPSKDSPHISLLNNPGESEMKSSAALFNPTQSMLDVFKPKKLSFQKGTQTHSTQHQEPFRPTIQPYTLYGEEISGTRSGSPSDKNDNGFLCRPVVEQTSQGAVRDNHSIHMVDEQYSGQCNSEDNIAYPYQLKLSDYNPLSYQGNFPNTFTGNVLTMSRMSMNKDHGQTNVTNQPEKIWPSFFKLNDPAMTDIGLLKKPFKSTTSVSEKSLSTRKERSKQVETDGPSDSNLVLTASSGDSNFSLFEALRDSIYSEVATLIAMNESRPHYLIELFRELQLLNSDYLRQRALYSLQELVTRFLTEEQVNPLPANEVSNQETESTLENKVPVFEKWTHSASEQTPSESLITTDDEAEAQALRSLAKQIQNNDMYDYAEIVESQSECNLSSPGSHSENPFAAEDLGNTVINLDEALHKMRFYEQKMTNAKRMFDQIARDAEASTASSVKLGGSKYQGPVFGGLRLRLNNQIDVASASSVCDVLSDTSSDMPQPSLDTEKLDQQIKSVMIDLIPFLNKSIESTCTDDILDQIRSHIVKSAKEKEPEAEKEKFGRFFHLQLDSILRDSLIKFQGRKIKECGEDILIDVSEILFNELAFFRLMQDLDRPFSADVVGASRQLMDEKGKTSKMPFIEDARCRIVDSNVATPEEYINTDTKSNSNSSTLSSNFVLVDHFETDEETESTRQFVKVELSASESKPVRSSGSGEDENEVQLLSFAQTTTPSPSMQVYSKQKQALAQGETPEEVELQVEINKPDQDIGAIQSEDVRYEANQYPPEDKSNEKEQEEIHMENENAEDQGNLDGAEVEADNRDCLLNPQSQNEVEDDDAAEDDLPEADMIADSNIAIADVILAHMDGRQETAQGSNLIEPS